MGDEDTDIITAQEASTFLKLNYRTILRQAAKGKIPGVRVGLQWRFSRRCLQQWITDMHVPDPLDPAATRQPVGVIDDSTR